MAADCTVVCLLAVCVVLAASDGVQRSSSNHRLRHGRGEPTREHRAAEPAELRAAAGEQVTLDCGDAAAPAARWFHDGQPAPASERLQPLPFGRLLVRRLRLTDAGLWLCRDPAGPRPRGGARALLLKVYVAPEEPFILIGDKPPPADAPLDVLENTVVTLTCVSERSLPPVAVTWFLGQPEVNVTGQSRTVTQLDADEQLYSTRSHLTLNVTRAMTGERVKCVTSHRGLDVRQQREVQLNVQYPPRFTVIRTPVFGYPILRGMRVNLTCLADASPPVQPRWAKDDSVPRVADKNGTLLFNPITAEDTGWYRCIASHLGSNASSYSFYLIVRDEAAAGCVDTVHATVGAPVSLKCTDDVTVDRSRGTPCWIRQDPGQEPAVASRGHRMHMDGATYEDTGVYTCQMPPISDIETARRAKARSFFVKVTGKPTVSNITLSSDAVLGQPAALRASFCADPPPTQLLWVVGQFAARPGHRSELAHAAPVADGALNSCFEATLFLPALRPEMAGDVTVLVVNARGADQLTRPLAVSRPSHVTFGGAGRPAAAALGVALAAALLAAW